MARETRERQNLGFEVARMIGTESAHGFLTYYARFDVAMILDLCWRIGATKEDPRVADLIKYILEIPHRSKINEFVNEKSIIYDGLMAPIKVFHLF